MTSPLSKPPATPGPAPDVLLSPVGVGVGVAAEPVNVVVLVTLPLTASAMPTTPVEMTTSPPDSVTVCVTVAVRVVHVQPAPQSPQPFHPAPPAPPTQGELSQAHPVTVTASPVKVEPQPPKFQPPAGEPPPPKPAPNWRLDVGAAESEEEVTVVAKGQDTVYTPVLPALEHDDHWSQSEEARLV